jgi:CHC2 zinc finger
MCMAWAIALQRTSRRGVRLPTAPLGAACLIVPPRCRLTSDGESASLPGSVRRSDSGNARNTGSSSLLRGLGKTTAPATLSTHPTLKVSAMPGIRFDEVRAMISLAEILDLVGFVAREVKGDQVRGGCPVHRSTSGRSRSFSANLKRNIYRCFGCGASGNQLDLYATVTGLSLFDAAVALCERLHRDIPWVQRW